MSTSALCTLLCVVRLVPPRLTEHFGGHEWTFEWASGLDELDSRFSTGCLMSGLQSHNDDDKRADA